jgi:16S rRNA (guanine527-N7)-methyltransferase
VKRSNPDEGEVHAAVAALLAGRGWPGDAATPLARLLTLQAVDASASTTVRAPREALDRHVADSLVALELEAVRIASRIADLGSGAGWPGLALAAALPDAHVTLVESAVRHCRYLIRTVEAMGLNNVDVVHARAEAWPAGLRAHDLVTARALASMPVLCEYASPLLIETGCLVAWKGTLDDDEAGAETVAADQLGMRLEAVVRVQPFAQARDRSLRVLRKIAPTPPRFPRRPGRARKRPLGIG